MVDTERRVEGLTWADPRHNVRVDVGSVPHEAKSPPGVLTNTNANLPDGRVGWFAVWRTGAEPLTISAFRMLDVETTA